MLHFDKRTIETTMPNPRNVLLDCAPNLQLLAKLFPKIKRV